MSVNKVRPHLLVLPEDDAYRQLANGFHLEVDFARQRQMQILPVAGGWTEVLKQFGTEHRDSVIRCPNRHFLLLVDFDERDSRFERIRQEIPPQIADRVFVLGVWSEPERLKQAGLGGYEAIGFALGRDCREETEATWNHALLRHNRSELDRLNQRVRTILF